LNEKVGFADQLTKGEFMKSNFRTLNLAMDIYKKASKLSLKGAMKSQYDRALLSVVLNISEGSAKPTRKDRVKFYYISYASLNETKTLLELSNVREYNRELDQLGAYLWKLIQNPGGV
jgi:four helix bundle protein